MGIVIYVNRGNDGDFEKVSPRRIVPALSVRSANGTVRNVVGCNNINNVLFTSKVGVFDSPFSSFNNTSLFTPRYSR